MSSLFKIEDNKTIIERIGKLTPETPALWGKMNVCQMMAHCSVPLKIATGEVKQKRSVMGIIFGNFVKKKLIGDDKPFRKNSPTDKNFIVADKRDFEEERNNLISNIEKFTNTGASGLMDMHPFFGKMTGEQWDRLMWKHLDHHLNQFGV